MGNRLHIQIKHEIEYGEEGFNWQIGELYNLLNECECDIYGTLNEDCVGDWEIPEEEFKSAIEKISEMRPEAVRKYFDKDYVGNDSDEVFKKKVLSLLRTFAETGDHGTGYYHLSWF